MDKLLALDEVMTTLLRIKNEGLELQMDSFYTRKEVLACNTVCCVAGWHSYFEEDFCGPFTWAMNIVDALKNNERFREIIWRVMFGSKRLNDVDKQIYVTRWFIAREERLREYNRIQALPKRERRLLDLAA